MYFIPKYILCLFFLIIVDFYAAKKIASTNNPRNKKILLLVSISSNFGLLFYFKYLAFFTESLNLALAGVFGTKLAISNTILPIGLSFHTFQSVSYVIDVYKNKIKPETHLGIYSSFVLFFPQMVAGPIERYSGLGSELKEKHLFKYDYLKKSIPLIIIGLFYKMVIADNCGEYVNQVYTDYLTKNHAGVMFGVFLFCIQIYSDFFGYSLIAQGSARLFGINLIDNFTFPFFSENLVIFWKKWHISLTSWFRDYVYIPLGGNKNTVYKHFLNIIIVFTLSGLWHGAGFNFILWGFVHALGYLFTYYLFKNLKLKIPKATSYLFTFLLVSLIFVFFRNGDLSETTRILHDFFNPASIAACEQIPYSLLFNILFILTIEYAAKEFSSYSGYLLESGRFTRLIVLSYMIFAILTFSGIDNLPFIYFQF